MDFGAGRHAAVALFALSVVFCSSNAPAATHEVRSCYGAVNGLSVAAPLVNRRLYVLVDQTVGFDQGLQTEFLKRIEAFLNPGDRIVLASFSAYAQGRHISILLDAVLDQPLSGDQRFYIGKNTLRSFDECLAEQSRGVRYLVSQDLLSAFGGSSAQLQHSEIIGTLNSFAETVRTDRAVSGRYVIVLSDMLEHSDIASFYSGGHLRALNPLDEIKKVERAGMLSDFAGARIYVMGAGYSSDPGYKPTTELNQLRDFWLQYFSASHAVLMEFGAPLLLKPIGQ